MLFNMSYYVIKRDQIKSMSPYKVKTTAVWTKPLIVSIHTKSTGQYPQTCALVCFLILSRVELVFFSLVRSAVVRGGGGGGGGWD